MDRYARRFALLVLFAVNALGATRTWTGTASNLWSNGANWGGTAPVPGDDLAFPVASNLSNSNDSPANTAFKGIFFSACNYVVSGNAIDLGSQGIGSNVVCMDTMQMPIRLTATQSWFYLGGPLHVDGAIDLNSQTLTLDDFGGVGGFIGGVISGNGTIVKQGPNFWTLSANNSFTGQLQISSGTLNFGAAQTLGGVAVTDDATLSLNGFAATIGSLAGSGTVNLGSGGALTVTTGTTTFGGTIGGSGQVVHSGGALTLTGANTFSGTYTNSGGTTLLVGVGSTLPASVTQSAGTFGVATGGTVGATTINAGTFEPGRGGNGVANSGSITMTPAATYSEVINGGSTALFGNLHVNGTLNLGGAALVLSGSGAFLGVGSVLTIIDNDGSDPVVGTFAGLPEGAIIPSGPGGLKYKISYQGGTGNDVVLMATELANIPALDPRALVALALVIAALAMFALRR